MLYSTDSLDRYTLSMSNQNGISKGSPYRYPCIATEWYDLSAPYHRRNHAFTRPVHGKLRHPVFLGRISHSRPLSRRRSKCASLLYAMGLLQDNPSRRVSSRRPLSSPRQPRQPRGQRGVCRDYAMDDDDGLLFGLPPSKRHCPVYPRITRNPDR